MNKVILVGHLGGNPEVKALTGGTVCNFSIATSEKWVQDGEARERTDWHKIVVWGKMAEVCGKYLVKGSQVAVEGKIRTREWEDNQGVKRYTTEVLAEHVSFLDRKKASGDDGGLPL
jgi:single-strand DNA-binding protein